MFPNDILDSRRTALGITIKRLAERTGLNYELTRRGMNGTRQFTATEFIRICNTLGLTLADFDERLVF